MRRTAGVVVVVAGAVLGVGSGVLAYGWAQRSTEEVVRTTDASGGLRTDGDPGGPPTAPGTGPATTRTGTPATSTTSGAPDPAAAVTPARLLGVRDLATAGWDTRAVVARTQTGEGAAPTGVCQRESLVARPGAGTRVRVDLVGRVTSVHEVASTFATRARAEAAYDVLVGDLTACRAGGADPGGSRVQVGPPVRVGVPTGDDRGVWSTVDPVDPVDPVTPVETVPSGTGTAPATSTTSATSSAGPPAGVMGVLLVGQRVAVVQVDDASPRPATVGTILSLAARRLAG
ncbi:hypothetical protein [Lapillicoccus jejuensis]|uniref:Uncharacterized protein n=1 Tax=Lapillicoccus jejuensis TaxID=402171 RepID=A0A542DXX4_9MICO|nr:hypothetical protein [Lapillicoccus jejuensis]TQJ07784.1 hypothetical protein FB458_0852 [Lapillicoccus jejuensis]